MCIRLYLRKAMLLALAFFCLSISVNAQDSRLGDLSDLPKLGEIRGVISFGNPDFNQIYLAVWYGTREPNVPYRDLLVIFEPKQGKYEEVFRYSGGEGHSQWVRLLPLSPGALTGIIISASEISSDDYQTLIVRVNHEFKVVYDGDAEFVDLNSDGFTEILESMWPDGDGYPETTTVYSWNGKTYKPLIKVKFEERFNGVVRAKVKSASRRLRLKRED